MKYIHAVRRFLNRRPKFTVGSSLLLVFPVTAFSLAYWQYERRKWKLDLIDQIKERNNLEPVSLLELNLDSVSEYTPVIVEGYWTEAVPTFVGPRHIITDNMENQEAKKVRQKYGNGIGYHLVMPIKLTNGSEILLNRGWISQNNMQNSEIKKVPTNLVRVEGVVRKIPRKSETPSESSLITDISQCKYANSFYVVAKYDKNVFMRGGPIGGQYKTDLYNHHLEYIVTWLALGVAGSWMWYKNFMRF